MHFQINALLRIIVNSSLKITIFYSKLYISYSYLFHGTLRPHNATERKAGFRTILNITTINIQIIVTLFTAAFIAHQFSFRSSIECTHTGTRTLIEYI
jgi:hypothetical protein